MVQRYNNMVPQIGCELGNHPDTQAMQNRCRHKYSEITYLMCKIKLLVQIKIPGKIPPVPEFI